MQTPITYPRARTKLLANWSAPRLRRIEATRLGILAETVSLRYSPFMSEKHLRYYYDIHYVGIERASGNEVKRNVIMPSPKIAPQVFPYQPLEREARRAQLLC